jgi:hypothetical protein
MSSLPRVSSSPAAIAVSRCLQIKMSIVGLFYRITTISQPLISCMSYVLLIFMVAWSIATAKYTIYGLISLLTLAGASIQTVGTN